MLHQEMEGQVGILLLYICEAHAEDEWPINSSRFNGSRGPVCVRQPTTESERIALARRFREDFPCISQVPMLVDSMDNEFERLFAPWPLRFFGINGERISYIARPQNCGYDILEVVNWCRRAKVAV